MARLETGQVLAREEAAQSLRAHAEPVAVELVQKTCHNTHDVALDALAVHEQLGKAQVAALQQVRHLPTQLVDVQREVELARLELLAFLTSPLAGGTQSARPLPLIVGDETRDGCGFGSRFTTRLRSRRPWVLQFFGGVVHFD